MQPYKSDSNRLWIYQNDYAQSIIITFSSETYFEDEYDYLYIFDRKDKLIGKYTNNEPAGKTVKVQVQILDGSNKKKVVKIKVKK